MVKAKTYKELLAEIAQLQGEAEAARKAELAAVIAEVKATIKVYGLTASDLGMRVTSAGKTEVAKFADPESGLQWGGIGKRPKWLQQALASGKTLEDFRVTR